MSLTDRLKNLPARKKIKLGFGAALLAGCLILVGLLFFAQFKLSRLVLGGLGESFSTKIYGRPYVIENGSLHIFESVQERLKRLGYETVAVPDVQPGQVFVHGRSLTIYLNGFQSHLNAQSSQLVKLEADSNSRWSVEDESGQELTEIALEPELVTELSGPQKVRREPAQWEEFPPDLVNAVISAEDHKFFHHWGIRPLSIARAFLHNLRHHRSLQGGSTITQQLAKNLFLTPKRNLRRKVAEAFLAVFLELRFTKEKIITLYLNHIYMGQDGFVSVAGMKAAAKHYFGQPLDHLTLEECALLAGLIRSPARYNPFEHPADALTRRNFVLKRMREENFISAEQEYDARDLPLKLLPQNSPRSTETPESYFVAEVVRILTPLYGDDAIYRYGLKIYTTLDPLLQEKAQLATKKQPFQVALIAMDSHSGEVLALIGGRNFKESQFNRATQARRQPGSAFKPFVYGAALEKGIPSSHLLLDEKRTYQGREKFPWNPRNFDNVYEGTVTVRESLAKSLNAATLDLINQIGPSAVVDFAGRMGILSHLESTLALALGAYEVTLLELTAAYAPFANGGFQVKPQFIYSIVDSDNEVIEINSPERKSVLDPALAFLMTSLLKSVVEEGTAQNLKKLGWDHPTAGKTGTTNEGRDGWFIGYTPYLLVGVWVGNDKAKPIQATGSASALPVWVRFMNSAFPSFPNVDFEKPTGLVEAKIDPVSGELAQSGCPQKIVELFLSGTEPKTRCHLHVGGLRGWFKRLFGN